MSVCWLKALWWKMFPLHCDIYEFKDGYFWILTVLQVLLWTSGWAGVCALWPFQYQQYRTTILYNMRNEKRHPWDLHIWSWRYWFCPFSESPQHQPNVQQGGMLWNALLDTHDWQVIKKESGGALISKSEMAEAHETIGGWKLQHECRALV